MAIRVAIGNNKGGSGKSSTTVNLGVALAEAGYRVLLVDTDPQANLSRRVGLDAALVTPDQETGQEGLLTTSELVHAAIDGSAVEAIVPPCGPEAPEGSPWTEELRSRIGVIPARFDLENRMSEAAVVGASTRLRRALEGADDDYDLTLLDCPPSLGHLTQLALVAADVSLGAVEPEYDGIAGMVRYRDFVANNAEHLGNPSLRMVGYVVGRVRRQVGAHTYQLEGLAETFGEQMVWKPYVPELAVIKDAADTASPLRAMPGGRTREMVQVYAELAQRLVKEIGL